MRQSQNILYYDIIFIYTEKVENKAKEANYSMQMYIIQIFMLFFLYFHGKKRAEEDEEKKQTYWFNFLDQQDCASIKQEIQTALGELRVNSEKKFLYVIRDFEKSPNLIKSFQDFWWLYYGKFVWKFFRLKRYIFNST